MASTATKSSSKEPPAPAASEPGTASGPTRDPAERRRTLALLAACVFSGVVWFLGCPGWDLWPLAWVAMVPVLYAAERAPTHRRALLYGWVAGAVGNAGGFHWISGLLTRFAHMPGIAAAGVLALFAAYQGLIFGLFALASRAIRKHTDLPMALIAPLAIVTFELITPVVFPFHVAITQSWQRHVIQIADVTGPLGVSALLLMVNGAVYDLLAEPKKRARSSAVAGLVLLAALGYGHLRIGQIERARAAAPQLNVGLVQPNVGFDHKGEITRGQWAARQLADLQAQSQRLDREGVDVIVWPETAYPFRLPRELEGDLPEGNRFRLRAGFNAPVVVGAVTRARRGEGSRFPYNTALMLDREGAFTGRYDKTFLMLFGEYTPGRDTFDWISRALPDSAGQYARGETTATLPLRTADGREFRLGPMICFEDILPEFGRALAPLHPNLLVNITNDAWFGDTAEPWEHLGLSVFRAVEMRADLVRAVNTGVSAFVDATGRVYQRTYAVDTAAHPHDADSTRGQVAMLEGGHTVYAAVGNLFGYLCTAATAFLWFAWPRLRRARGAA